MSDITPDCYSNIDRHMMQWFQKLRARSLMPLLKCLKACHIKADGISFIALICGISSCFFYSNNPPVAFILLSLHILLDGLDGPLARHRKEASPAGSFVDTFCDQLVVCATAIAFVSAGILETTCALIYTFSYTLVIAFSMIRNAMGIPYLFLIRPRFFIYGLAFSEILYLPGILTPACFLFSFILCYQAISGFLILRRELKARHLSSRHG